MTDAGIKMSQRTASKDVPTVPEPEGEPVGMVQGAGGGEEIVETTAQGAGNAGGGTPVATEEVLTTNQPTEPRDPQFGFRGCCPVILERRPGRALPNEDFRIAAVTVEEIILHINYAHATSDYGEETSCFYPCCCSFFKEKRAKDSAVGPEAAEAERELELGQDLEHRSCLTKCCYPREKDLSLEDLELGQDLEHRSRLTKCCYPREKDLSLCCICYMPYRHFNREHSERMNEGEPIKDLSREWEGFICAYKWCCGYASRRKSDYYCVQNATGQAEDEVPQNDPRDASLLGSGGAPTTGLGENQDVRGGAVPSAERTEALNERVVQQHSLNPTETREDSASTQGDGGELGLDENSTLGSQAPTETITQQKHQSADQTSFSGESDAIQDGNENQGEEGEQLDNAQSGQADTEMAREQDAQPATPRSQNRGDAEEQHGSIETDQADPIKEFDKRHKNIMNSKIRSLNQGQWNELRAKIHYLGNERFESTFNTLQAISLIQTLGVIFLFIEIKEDFNEHLLYDALFLYSASLGVFMFINAYATVRDSNDPFRRDHQPGLLKIKDIVHYLESTNFSYRLFQTLLVFHVCLSVAYLFYFIAIIDCQIALTQGRNDSRVFFFESAGTCVDAVDERKRLRSQNNTAQSTHP